jgi:hypothetical protein
LLVGKLKVNANLSKTFMKKLFPILLCFFLNFSSAFGQVKSDGKWYFPDSVRAMCVNTEQGLVAQFKSLIERNREWADPNSQSDKSNYFQITEAIKKGILESETTWDKLGCVHILYGSDRLSGGKR